MHVEHSAQLDPRGGTWRITLVSSRLQSNNEHVDEFAADSHFSAVHALPRHVWTPMNEGHSATPSLHIG